MKIKDLVKAVESFAPPALAESYDNAGLIVGDPNVEATGILINLDVTEEMIAEAAAKGLNMIVTHHPIWFVPRKRLNGEDYVSRIIISAIKHEIALYACHTNLDNVYLGVNQMMSAKLGLENTRILSPKPALLHKLVVYVPTENRAAVSQAMWNAGAGNLGNYSEASFSVEGEGSFRPNEQANPAIGSRGELEFVKESRIEVVFPAHLKGPVLSAMHNAHPYEEVAYQLIATENAIKEIGSGMIGEFPTPFGKEEFLKLVRNTFDCGGIRYADATVDQIKKVALCGGAGSFLIKKAMRAGADAFLTGDITYHKFFDAESKMLLCDIGHYESEQFTSQLLHTFFSKNFPNFAVHLSEIKTNPVKYFN